MDQLCPLPPDQNDDAWFSAARCFIGDVDPFGWYDTHVRAPFLATYLPKAASNLQAAPLAKKTASLIKKET